MGLFTKRVKNPEDEFKITVTDDFVHIEHPKRKTEEIRWEDINEVRLVNTDAGPTVPKVWLALIGVESRCLLPQGTSGYDAAYDIVSKNDGFSVNYQFSHVLNDLYNYFILGDIKLLNSWQKKNNLPDDLATVFTTSVDGDNAVSEGIILPMVGINDYPYTVIFRFSSDTPELLKKENRLQIRQSGYSLKVENNVLTLFTWSILEQFTDDNVNTLMDIYSKHDFPQIELENGWYSVEIIGGETLQEEEIKNIKTHKIERFLSFEPTFEFILKKTDNQQKGNVDIHFNFAIESSEY
ncbi:hypothetical protein LQZ18_06205 [Lachnospiraceae bacterium ZAX-1]